ncbi:hypothetical protein BL253_20920 [Pseudofrankia asymbiotica]|uniref:FAD-binding domain-containing protein n=1 Tax=Pseudofrankia asymbiotica TaxID=1834516 RepID=A0A1V2I8N3_9ACTN|nr:hypothetical protein BL253_20920 [Pseudofrankia asymbiotica]
MLVVGGGTAGAAAAILLADAGVHVDLVELKPDVTALGSGITLQGNALRVLRQLGVLDECLAQGWPSEGLVLRAPDPAATVLAELAEHRSGGPDLPAVHTCPPTLAQGAALALEDAAVLTELLTTADSVDDELLRAFADRRLDRVRTVVEASLQLARWQLTHEQGDVPALMGRIAALTSQPA